MLKFMKIKNIILFCGILIPLCLSGQYMQLNTSGVTDNGLSVSAVGEVFHNEGSLSGWIQNTSVENSSLVGVWFLSPENTLESNLFVSEPWDFSDSTPSYMNNLIGPNDSDLYLGLDLDISEHGLSSAIQNNETLMFSFELTNSFLLTESELPLMAFRWQEVGFDGEDSAKTIGFITDDTLTPVPEPSVIGIASVFGLLSIILYKRRKQ